MSLFSDRSIWSVIFRSSTFPVASTIVLYTVNRSSGVATGFGTVLCCLRRAIGRRRSLPSCQRLSLSASRGLRRRAARQVLARRHIASCHIDSGYYLRHEPAALLPRGRLWQAPLTFIQNSCFSFHYFESFDIRYSKVLMSPVLNTDSICVS